MEMISCHYHHPLGDPLVPDIELAPGPPPVHHIDAVHLGGGAGVGVQPQHSEYLPAGLVKLLVVIHVAQTLTVTNFPGEALNHSDTVMLTSGTVNNTAAFTELGQKSFLYAIQ